MMKCPHCQKDIVFALAKPSTTNDRPPAEGRSNSNPSHDNFSMYEDAKRYLDMIEDDTLTGTAVDFVAKQRERLDQYGEKLLISEKQLKWLKELAEGRQRESDDDRIPY